MTKEDIIEIIERAFERERSWEAKATDELFELLEREEDKLFKNTLIELIKFFNFNQNGTEASYSMGEIEDVIREFAEINGVEL